jgi:hypothetical protein
MTTITITVQLTEREARAYRRREYTALGTPTKERARACKKIDAALDYTLTGCKTGVDWLADSVADTRRLLADLPEDKREALEYDAEFRRAIRRLEDET